MGGTGNKVWLCATSVPPEAILRIAAWDGLPEGRTLEDEDPVEQSGTQAVRSSAVLPIRPRVNRKWGPIPDEERRQITEEILAVARNLGENLPADAGQGISVDLTTESVTTSQPEARFAPGGASDESGVDWEGSGSEIEIIQAIPAGSQAPSVPAKKESEEPKIEAKEETSPDQGAEAGAVKIEVEPPTTHSPERHGENPASSSEGHKNLELLQTKDQEMVTEEEEPKPRRRRVRFGDVHLHLLKAVADADAANWTSLQEAIQRAPAASKTKSEFVERLNQLAEARLKSREEAEVKAEEKAQRAKRDTEEETDYRKGLNDQMLRLELMNPVGPRTEVPMISDNRLRQEIEAGRSVWMARRAHRARERAAHHRKETNQRSRAEKGPEVGPLHDVAPQEAGSALDQALDQTARHDLKVFRDSLKEAAQKEAGWGKRAPETAQRRQAKKQRKKEKKRNSKDDAERDRNHAIAHQASDGSFSPGGLMHQTSNGDLRRMTPGLVQASEVDWSFDLTTGVILDILMVALVIAILRGVSWLGAAFRQKPRVETRPRLLNAHKVGGTRKKVRFNLPKKGRRVVPEPTVPFLGGPRAAARRHPAGKSFRFAQIQGRHEFDQEGFSLLLSRYSQSTAVSYQSQWSWWALFCKRRGEDPVRYVPAYKRAEEQLVIDYLVHCASNETKAPGTIKLRLSAIRSMHLTLGYPDPLMHMPRVPLALAGLRRRFGTKERRMPVTPDMLKWLGEHLQYGKTEEASLIWGALTLGFFFLLRASEYLDVGYQDPRRGLRGSDVTLKLNGRVLELTRIHEADEVTLLVRGSKTDIYNRGQVRNHFRTSEQVCAVKSMITLF